MMQRRTRRAGFTLLEAAIATSIFALIGYSLTVCMATANDSQRTVFSVAAQDRALREATSTLTDELRTSSDSMITVTTLADSDSQVDLQMPVESGATCCGASTTARWARRTRTRTRWAGNCATRFATSIKVSAARTGSSCDRSSTRDRSSATRRSSQLG